MTDPVENGNEESGFEQFASRALRLSRKGSFELLLSQHLAVATPSDPMVKARLLCEASWMVPQDKLKLDMQLIEAVYLTCLSFLNTNTHRVDGVSIAWGFKQTKENYDRYIKPWHKGVPLTFLYETDAEKLSKNRMLQQAEAESKRFFLYTCFLDLPLGNFQMLRTEFLRWAIPQVMTVFEQLSKLIDPDLYQQMLGALKLQGKRGEEQH